MFQDNRSKSVMIIAHCIINQNAISDGTASYAGTINEVMELLNSLNVGIIQMPCPELHCLGLDRGDIYGGIRPVIEENSRIRKMMKQNAETAKISRLIQLVVYQIEEYINNGFEIKGIIGVDRSPTCGVNSTSLDNKEVSGQGIFIEELRKEIRHKGYKIEFVGIKASEPEQAVSKIKNLTGKK